MLPAAACDTLKVVSVFGARQIGISGRRPRSTPALDHVAPDLGLFVASERPLARRLKWRARRNWFRLAARDQLLGGRAVWWRSVSVSAAVASAASRLKS